MKPVEMKHANSKMTIVVQAAQVSNAKYHGWFEVEPKAVKQKARVKKNGESKR